MSVLTAQSVIDRAGILLQDTTNIRWPQAELLGWLNDAQREITMFKPNAYVTNAIIPLVSGTRQTLPPTSNSLIDVVCNVGADGVTRGSAVRIVSREILDAQVPGWHLSANANATVKHYVYDEQDPKTFYVYPPQPASPGKLEAVLTQSPTDIAATATLSLDDVYSTTILNYMLHRAYSKDAEYAANANLASAYYQAFISAIGGKTASEMATTPNARTKGNTNVI